MNKKYFQNINEISDSTEMMYEYPKKIISGLSYIIIALFLVFFIWAFVSDKDTYIEANGFVRPFGDISNITTISTGLISEVDYTEGQEVKKGDVLFSYDIQAATKMSDELNNRVQGLEEDILNLTILQNSINQGKNLIDSTSLSNEYYAVYQRYLVDVDIAKEQYENNNLDIEAAKLNLQTNINTLSQTIDSLNSNKNQLELLIREVEADNLDSLNMDNINSFFAEFTAYKNSVDSLKSTIADTEELEVKLIELKNEFLASLKSSLDNVNSQIDSNNKNLNSVKSSETVLSNKGFTVDFVVNQTKLGYIIDITSQINSKEAEIDSILFEKINIDETIRQASVLAPIDGTVTVYKQIVAGENSLAGENILSIMPTESEKLIFTAYLSSTDIDEIEIDSNVKIRLDALPYSDHHDISAEVISISADARSDENGNYFYEVKCLILDTEVLSNNNEAKEIIVGMTGQMHVVTKTEKVIDWVLRKLDFIN